MKKLFNHTKRPIQEWEDFDESNYDWNEEELELQEEYNADEIPSDAGEYGPGEDMPENGGMYYEDIQEDVEAEEYIETPEDDGEGYYAEAPEGEEEEYYAEVPEGEEEGYYAEAPEGEEGEYYAEAPEGEEEEYYAEAPEGEEGEYYTEAPEEEEEAYYAGEEYEAEEDGAEEVLPPGKTGRLSSGGRSADRSSVGKGAAGRIAGKKKSILAQMDIMDRVIVGTGITVLLLALITGVVYIRSKIKMNQIASFASVGSQLNNIDMIGEDGLLAVADAQIAKQAVVDIVEEGPLPSQEDEPNEGYQEQEYRREVQVKMEFVSIQKDLKIKFVNEKTGKLVANVPFVVTVTDPNGKSMIWSDDDMDGIIYKKDIASGNYKITMEALTDERYANYTVSTMARTTEVKKEIAYEKVEVANEIKSEQEVDASQEDTNNNETEVESTLQDTVAWVESSVLAATYSEVPKSSIPVPTELALSKSFTRATSGGTVSGGDTGEGNGNQGEGGENSEDNGDKTLPKGTVKLEPGTVSVVRGGTITSQATVSEFADGRELKYSISPESNQYASVEIDSTGKITVTGRSEGTTQFTVTVNYAEGGTEETEATATLNVTVTPPKTLNLDKTAATAYIGEPLILTVTVPNTEAPVITAVSQDESIATVSVNRNEVKVNGLVDGKTVNITVSLTENNIVTAQATCVVTVKEHPKNDKVSLLKDDKGNQLYVQENGEYREATFADYYVESYKFYLMNEPRYTGWQTLNGKVYYFTAQYQKVTGDQVIQGAMYHFASDGSLVTGSGTLGIDVSKWNGDIDWKAVKNSGVSYVIIRCGYRGKSEGSLIEDPKFAANIKGATAAGLKVGVYFFTQAMDEREAVEEASMVLELVKNYTISYPIFLDVEACGGRADAIDKATRTAVCKAFCRTIKNAGYTSGIYANKNWLTNKINASELNEYRIWVAQYAATRTYSGKCDLWQYSSTGTISGIKTNVDMNLSYLGY